MRHSTFKKEYCKQLIEHMGQGLSYRSFGAVVGVVSSTLYYWEEKHPEWKKTKDIAMAKAQLFFEKRLIAQTPWQ